MTNESQQGLCPLLGLVADRSVMLSGVSDHHRCYANSLPAQADGLRAGDVIPPRSMAFRPYYNADVALAAPSDTDRHLDTGAWVDARSACFGVAVLFSGAILAGLVLFSTGEFDQAVGVGESHVHSGRRERRTGR
ncbi:MAG: hypothetical protein R3A10_16615 [Caldilineaceae bacterium]